MPVACSTTSVLTGQEGSLWFSQPGARACLTLSDFRGPAILYGAGGSTLAVGDALKFATTGGYPLPASTPQIVAGATYYVVSVDWPENGAVEISATEGGTPITFDVADLPYKNAEVTCVTLGGGDYANSDVDNGTDSICTDAPHYDAAAFNPGVVDYDNADITPRYMIDVHVSTVALPVGNVGHIEVTESAEVICQVRSFSAEVQREEQDATVLPCSFDRSRNYAQFRAVQSGYAGLTGTVSVLIASDQTAAANKMLRAVMERSQSGAFLKLYVNTVADAMGVVDDTTSMVVAFKCALTSMSLSVTPDDLTTAEVAFSATEAPSQLIGS